MPSSYSEQHLVEQSAIRGFVNTLGYTHQDCFDEQFGANSTLGRETTIEVVLIPRLKKAITNLNSNLPPEAINLAIEELTKDRSVLNPVVANREIYKMLRDGVKVAVRREDGGEDTEVVRVVDFNNPDNNDFFLASQFWITGDMYKRRADLIGFVNGLPLIFIELKAIHRRLRNAYDGNLRDYKDTIPQLFWYNALIILSNGSDSKAGTITAEWEHFNEWKKINSEGEEGIISLETIIKGMCDKKRFLDILENFILYQDIGGSLIKIIGKNHQYLGVNNTIDSFKKIEEKKGRLGVYWHTQGSGKSFSMILFSQKVLRKFHGNYTFVIVTDRIDLDRQIYKNFVDVGAITEKEVHAESGEHLNQLLRENHRNIFTIIHKFRTGEVISDRKDIIVIADEAHRTQYDTFAMNMRQALPNAAFIAFTATPLIEGEEKTKSTFGDYVSIYSFKQSVDDQATVPLYYENRIPEVQLENKLLGEDFGRIVEETVLDEREEAKLVREFAREYHVITRDDRLEKIAEDIVAHFINRGYQGKGMVVSIDKPTAVKMYDKVQKHWKKNIETLKKELKTAKDKDRKEIINNKIKYMKETDMAVVVSGEQNEVARFRELELDIATHRRRMNKEDLDTKFKDPEDKFRIVFVCAMWMTGFDVPSLSTIYLDKPMRNHTLMQTIARANRVFGEKSSGLIVDYAGIFKNLKRALAIYTPGPGVDYPVRPKEELLKDLEEVIGKIVEMFKSLRIDYDEIIKAEGFEKISLLDGAVDILLADREQTKEFVGLANLMKKLYKSIKPDPRVLQFEEKYRLFNVIRKKIASITTDPEPVDISDAKERMEDLLDESVKVKEYIIKSALEEHKYDLSKIDFDKLKREFVQKHKHIETEKLKNAIRRKLIDMLQMNRTREDFLKKFQDLIAEYNSGAVGIEILFEKLISFAKDLNEEEKRGIKENLTEEELAIFDLLYKPGLKKKEKEKIKSIAKELLEKLKRERLVLDWRRKQQARAGVELTIQKILDRGLPSEAYPEDIYREKCRLVYQHVYDSYFGQNRSVYMSLN